MEKQEKKPRIKFIYSEHDPPCFYVHGARGGPTADYDFRIDFYSDKVRNPDVEILFEDNSRGSEFTSTDEDYNEMIVVDRNIEASIILSFTAAKELAAWITNNLKKHENRVMDSKKEKISG
ncbi:MAG: hypothetical protein PVF58_01370 [Candidatus Methanofastidiosia archaeon]|jgi:hypothetical protein